MTSEPMHEAYMMRCLELAARGKGEVAPNPLVGCVIVHENKIIGEGWHKKYGEAHAEINALQSTFSCWGEVEALRKLKDSTLYVNLEPCAHFGKTPPCVDAILLHEIKKVVIANRDPFHQVDGKGIERLRQAGVEVLLGVLEKNALHLNRRFFTFHEKKRPYIILKWAETLNQFMALHSNQRMQISGKNARVLLHQWRSEEQAFLVGSHTYAIDKPLLDSRLWGGKNPVRMVIDPGLKSGKIFPYGNARVYNFQKQDIQEETKYIKVEPEQVIEQMLKDAYQEKIQSVVVEGGKYTLDRFMERGLYDEIRVFKSKWLKWNNGIEAPRIPQKANRIVDLGEDLLELYYI